MEPAVPMFQMDLPAHKSLLIYAEITVLRQIEYRFKSKGIFWRKEGLSKTSG